MARRIAVAFGFLAIAILAIAMLAIDGQAQDQQWLAALRQQARSEQSCDLAFIVHQRELRIGEDVSLEGRLRCIDGREFDFTRARVHEKFGLRLCQPVYC